VYSSAPEIQHEISLGNFSAKVGREDVLKPPVAKESLHEISKCNGLRVVHFAITKTSIVKNKMFPHRSFYKYIWTPPD
jgi:hypothetical protein